MTHHPEPDPPEIDELDPLALVATAAEHVTDQARRHPYRTLGIALGVGYVLGGGLPRFVVRMAGAAVLRSVGHAVLSSDTVMELARGLLHGDREDTHDHAKPRERDSGGRFTS